MGDDDASDFVRLHISPLDAELVKVVIPASVLPSARNISYHTLETFPERRYGFVDLPAADAEKLRRKLNGTTLKGCKMRVEKARPETRLEPTGPEDGALETKKKKLKDDKDKSKKRKREPDVLEGVALHDRQVKRGWTEAPTANKRKDRKNKESKDKDKGKEKEKKKRPKSKYTEGEECLLKTKLPPNTMKNLAPEELEQKKRSSKKKGGSSRQVVIHEFEKTTTFPSFLKTSTTTDQKKAAEFVEGKGWVDEEGNLVEEVKEKKEKTKLPRRPKKAPPPKKVPEESDDDDSTSSSGTSSEGTSSEDEEESEAESEADAKQEAKKETKKEAAQIPSLVVTKAKVEDEKENDSDTSSDNTSDSDESEDEEDEDAKHKDQSSKATKAATPTPSSKTPASKSTPINTKPLAIKIPPPETPTNGGKVHPLEALYKRPKPDGNNPTSAPKEAEPFSFFAAADEDDIDETSEAIAPPASLAPMTPFTRQDFEWRNVRSAAPTPDTAHPSRAHRFWASPDKEDDVEMEDDVTNALREDYHYPEEEEEEEGEGGEDGDDDGPAQGRHSATTDFQKWFWENRRDLNRSWMTRRKTAAKERRHRENKARASKAV